MHKFQISILMTLLIATTVVAVEKRVALVIGNGNYTNISTLKNAANDANDMSAKLSNMGFEVIKGINLNKRQMNDKIRLFDDKIRQGNAEETVALFFYAGHGLEVEGKNYIVPVNADMQYQDDVEYEGIVLDKITSRMQRTNAKLNLIVLDACRNNPLPKRNRALPGGWGAINSVVQGTFIAFGTSPGRKAADSDGTGRNGLFTKHILNYIDQPGFTLEQIFKNVRGGVFSDSNKKQLTWSNNATIGDFYFVAPDSNTIANINSVTKPPISYPIQTINTSRQVGETYQDCTNCPEMVVIPAGSFQMGSNKEGREKPIHRVNIKQFSMSTTEVTFNQWDACYNAGGCNYKLDDEGWGRGTRPVINMSWNSAKEYTKWLSNKTGKKYRLPSESEWEYAAQAGRSTKYSWGNIIGSNKANCYSNDCGDSYSYTSPVKSFSPNKFGLYDMHGNVMEWVEDKWHDNYNGAPTDGSAWTSGSSSLRMLRGGSWFTDATELRSASRSYLTPSPRQGRQGFRLARDQ